MLTLAQIGVVVNINESKTCYPGSYINNIICLRSLRLVIYFKGLVMLQQSHM
jgi:hypothetical protein